MWSDFGDVAEGGRDNEVPSASEGAVGEAHVVKGDVGVGTEL